MNRDVPYAALFIFAAVFAAIALMIWAMAGTRGGRVQERTASEAESAAATK